MDFLPIAVRGGLTMGHGHLSAQHRTARSEFVLMSWGILHACATLSTNRVLRRAWTARRLTGSLRFPVRSLILPDAVHVQGSQRALDQSCVALNVLHAATVPCPSPGVNQPVR